MAQPQWKARLNRYHQFAVTKLCDFEEEERTVMLGQIVANWLRDHNDLVSKAGASREEWEAVRATWEPPVLREPKKGSKPKK